MPEFPLGLYGPGTVPRAPSLLRAGGWAEPQQPVAEGEQRVQRLRVRTRVLLIRSHCNRHFLWGVPVEDSAVISISGWRMAWKGWRLEIGRPFGE